MLHHLFLVMSLAGSAVVLLYGIAYPITRRYFPHAWRKRILHLALFFYLFPVPLFRYRVQLPISHWLTETFPFLVQYQMEHYDRSVEINYMVNLKENNLFIGAGAAAVFVLMVCMIGIALVTVIKQVRQYHRLRERYLSHVFQETVPPGLEKEFERIREELKLGKNVRLISSRLCETPMTMGVFSPTVILPASAGLRMGPEDRGYILKHELLHIKYRDLAGKFLALFALALHWYNPFCYLLYRELCAVSELDCDYGVIKDANASQRKSYGGLILDMAAAQGRQERFAVGLIHDSAATFRRRLLEVKEPGRNKRPILACVMLLMIGLAGTVTAFAYRPINTHGFVHEIDPDSEYGFVPWWEPAEDYVKGPLPYDRFFTDENGEVYAPGGCGHQAYRKRRWELYGGNGKLPFLRPVRVRDKERSSQQCWEFIPLSFEANIAITLIRKEPMIFIANVFIGNPLSVSIGKRPIRYLHTEPMNPPIPTKIQSDIRVPPINPSGALFGRISRRFIANVHLAPVLPQISVHCFKDSKTVPTAYPKTILSLWKKPGIFW